MKAAPDACALHPRYEAHTAPTTLCEDCWLVWIGAADSRAERRSRARDFMQRMEEELE